MYAPWPTIRIIDTLQRAQTVGGNYRASRSTLIGRMPWHEERNRLFCIADSWKSQPVQVRRYRGCHSLALSYTRYINSRSNGFFPSVTALHRPEKSYSASDPDYPHRESCILRLISLHLSFMILVPPHLSPVRLPPRHDFYVVNSKSNVPFFFLHSSSFFFPSLFSSSSISFVRDSVRVSDIRVDGNRSTRNRAWIYKARFSISLDEKCHPE